MDINDNSSDDFVDCTPPEVLKSAKNSSLELLPIKSQARYQICYKSFMKWREDKKTHSSFFENVLMAYSGMNGEAKSSQSASYELTNDLTILQVFRITDFCAFVWMVGLRPSCLRCVWKVCGVRPVVDMTSGMISTTACLQSLCISMAKSFVLPLVYVNAPISTPLRLFWTVRCDL
ncbi:hypothetical protein NQ315_003499 [Exocentrus adspersus]|uniref:Uncharacterized protein n=1 Tax=Exocentrus adspersus TaxID=1586481 RepID=A0AAV8V7J3_9CUCU|nr:hypothetical protein NQ315_003499 [Exocentrus adspersus]